MVTVKFNSHQLKMFLNATEMRQVNFAESVALNSIAFRSRKAIVANLKKKYTLRNKFTEKSFRVEKATKKNLYSQLYSIAKYMPIHETGGEKKPEGHRWISVPQSGVKRTKRGIVSKSKYPGKLRHKKYRLMDSKKGKILIEFRKNNKPLLLWGFETKTKYKPTLDFEKTGNAIAGKFAGIEFQKAFELAMRTARK